MLAYKQQWDNFYSPRMCLLTDSPVVWHDLECLGRRQEYGYDGRGLCRDVERANPSEEPLVVLQSIMVRVLPEPRLIRYVCV